MKNKVVELYESQINEMIANARTDAIDRLKSNCIVHIQKEKPLTIEEIIHIIQFESYKLKEKTKNE